MGTPDFAKELRSIISRFEIVVVTNAISQHALYTL